METAKPLHIVGNIGLTKEHLFSARVRTAIHKFTVELQSF